MMTKAKYANYKTKEEQQSQVDCGSSFSPMQKLHIERWPKYTW